MSGLTDSGNFNQYASPIVAVWTSATTTSTAVTLNTAGLDTVAITISSASTITGGTIQFNVWDGAAFIPVKCARLSSYNTDSSYVIPNLGSAQIQGWTVPCAGYPQFQFILTGAITGTGSVTITTISSSAPDVSIVTAGLDPNSTMPPYAANTVNPTASNGLTSFRTANVTTTAVGAVKASGGKVHRITVASSATGNNYLKLYNTASVTVGTTTPVYTITVPPAGLTVVDLFGLSFSTAISFAVTGAYADTDTTAPTGYTAQIDYV